MQVSNQHQPEREHDMQRIIRTIEVASGVGLLFCAVNIARTDGDIFYILYASWFAVAIASFEAIVNWYKAGVYALIAATVVLTAVEFLSGMASLGGASLAVMLFVILYVYIAPVWSRFE
ncbi:MAG: hypothetical protein RLP44_00720 [Aggregatilineales bacterium]